jgi:hypothetical protein
MSILSAPTRSLILRAPYTRDPLWRIAQQVPAFDIDFTRQTIVDRIAGITPTFTRPSSEKRLWNGSAFQTYAADVPGFELRNGIWEYVHEPAATNLYLNSGDVTLAAVSTGLTRSLVSSSLMPSGEIGRIAEDTSTGFHRITSPITLVSGTVYTFSTVASVHSGNGKLTLLAGAGGLPSQQDARFELSTGTVGNVSTANGTTAAIRSLGSGLFLCSITTAAATSSAASNFGLWLFDNSNNASYTGTGANGINILYAQLETGPVATSPIVTSGSAVTRNADVMSITGTPAADLIARLGSSYWAYVEGTSVSGANAAFISADDNTANERWRISHNGTSAGQAVAVDGGSVTANNLGGGGSWPLGAYRKAVGAFAQDNVRLALTGQPLIADTSATLPTVTQFKIGAAQTVSTVPVLFIRRIALFPGIPSDALLNTMVV